MMALMTQLIFVVWEFNIVKNRIQNMERPMSSLET